ncbi:putative lipoprotein [Peptoanaerobacter stomatis]|uniref:Putative lipoprotein n=1 Tax=Peptoanaerobacter stomatis TaxID=796937 RepID=J5UB54_9FIRM|nr:hypothetical protein [Peptoanaerobacter stomatis]EJU21174.1 putative lipoprotein [Peptoanaerobacter stomatis]
MKKLLSLLCSAVIMFSFTACGNTSEKKEENQSSKENVVSTDEKKPEEQQKEEKKIEVGQTITSSSAEITIKKIEFSYDVLPDDVSGFYTHYPAEKGHVYIHVDTDVKNIQKQQLEADDILTVTADYNNGYQYSGDPIPEDSSTGFTYANITSIDPLSTLGVRYLIDCPQEVEESQNPVILKFMIDNEEYVYKMR